MNRVPNRATKGKTADVVFVNRVPNAQTERKAARSWVVSKALNTQDVQTVRAGPLCEV
jgi:hypothetical protein